MRFPWQKREEDQEFYEEEKPKKPRETLTQTADKIIQRKMKQDPDGYGIIASERIKRISHPEPKTIKDWLKELREYKELMTEMGGEGGGGGTFIQNALAILKELPGALAALKQMTPEQMQQITQQGQVQGQAQQIRLQQAQQQVQIQPPKTLELKLDALMPLIELSPEECWQELQNRGEMGWIGYLSATSLEEIEALLNKIAEEASDPIIAEGIQQFLATKHKWLTDLIVFAHNTGNNE